MTQLLADLLATMGALDRQIEAHLYEYGTSANRYWGFMTRTGFNEKSHIMRQIEKYADIYTSKVSNMLRYTPYMYFRTPQQSLAHDRNLTNYQLSLVAALNEPEANGFDAPDDDHAPDGHAADSAED